MPPVTVSTDIDRPASEVFAYATDPSRFHEWQKGVVSGEHTPARPDGTPERCLTIRRIGLADRPNTSDVVQSDPPRTWRIRGIDGPIRAQVGVDVQDLGADRSRLTRPNRLRHRHPSLPRLRTVAPSPAATAPLSVPAPFHLATIALRYDQQRDPTPNSAEPQ